MADVLSATKQYKRLFCGTLDPSMSWDSLDSLREYLKDPTCPPNMVVGAEGRAYITLVNENNEMDISELGAIDETQFGQMASKLLKDKYDDVQVTTVTKEDGSIVSMIQFYANGVAVDDPIEVGGSSLTADQLDSLNRIDQAVDTSNEALDKSVTTESKLTDYITSNDEKLLELERKLNDMNYKEITTKTFSIYPPNGEIGSTIDATISWEYTKDPTSQSLNGTDLDVLVRSYVATNVSSNTTFKLIFSDGITENSKSISISFLNSRFFGVSSSKEYNSNLINSLTKTLTGTKNCTFSVTSGDGEYIYYCIPTRFGEPSFYVGGFEGGFMKVATIDFTNTSNYTESYDIYRSDYSNLGNITVIVK